MTTQDADGAVAAVAALLWIPVRERLSDFATRRVYGERHAPDEVIRTFGSRLTRALPLDELPDLVALAHKVRLAYCGPTVELESLINAKSGACPEDCSYCPQSVRYDTGLQREEP